MTGLTLYEHETRLREMHELVVDALADGHEPDDETLTVVREYAIGAAEKRDACAAVLRRLEADEEHIGAEIKRLHLIRSHRENARERLKAMIVQVMQSAGATKLKGVDSSFTLVQNPPSVEVGAVEALPPEYTRTIPAQVVPDKVAIKDALKRGEDVPGARLIEGAMRLQVR